MCRNRLSILCFGTALLLAAARAIIAPIGATFNDVRRPKRQSRRAHERLSVSGCNKVSYRVQVEIGDPGQAVTMFLDTGSSDLWVSTEVYDHTASQDYQADGRPYHIAYVDGDSVDGTLARDTVSLGGGLALKQQLFAEVASSHTSSCSEGGIVGFGMAELASVDDDFEYDDDDDDDNNDDDDDDDDDKMLLKHQVRQHHRLLATAGSSSTPIVRRLYEEGQIDAPIFSIALQKLPENGGSGGGAVTIGGTDSSMHLGEVQWYPLTSKFGAGKFWEFELPMVSLGAKQAGSLAREGAKPLTGLVDSGTTFMYGPHDSVVDLYSAIPDLQCWFASYSPLTSGSTSGNDEDDDDDDDDDEEEEEVSYVLLPCDASEDRSGRKLEFFTALAPCIGDDDALDAALPTMRFHLGGVGSALSVLGGDDQDVDFAAGGRDVTDTLALRGSDYLLRPAACAPGEFMDCSGECLPDAYRSWIGDGVCEDGSGAAALNCASFGCDGGDCGGDRCFMGDPGEMCSLGLLPDARHRGFFTLGDVFLRKIYTAYRLPRTGTTTTSNDNDDDDDDDDDDEEEDRKVSSDAGGGAIGFAYVASCSSEGSDEVEGEAPYGLRGSGQPLSSLSERRKKTWRCIDENDGSAVLEGGADDWDGLGESKAIEENKKKREDAPKATLKVQEKQPSKSKKQTAKDSKPKPSKPKPSKPKTSEPKSSKPKTSKPKTAAASSGKAEDEASKAQNEVPKDTKGTAKGSSGGEDGQKNGNSPSKAPPKESESKDAVGKDPKGGNADPDSSSGATKESEPAKEAGAAKNGDKKEESAKITATPTSHPTAHPFSKPTPQPSLKSTMKKATDKQAPEKESDGPKEPNSNAPDKDRPKQTPEDKNRPKETTGETDEAVTESHKSTNVTVSSSAPTDLINSEISKVKEPSHIGVWIICMFTVIILCCCWRRSESMKDEDEAEKGDRKGFQKVKTTDDDDGDEKKKRFQVVKGTSMDEVSLDEEDTEVYSGSSSAMKRYKKEQRRKEKKEKEEAQKLLQQSKDDGMILYDTDTDFETKK